MLYFKTTKILYHYNYIFVKRATQLSVADSSQQRPNVGGENTQVFKKKFFSKLFNILNSLLFLCFYNFNFLFTLIVRKLKLIKIVDFIFKFTGFYLGR